MKCKKCDYEFSRAEIASAFGALTSKRKSESSRKNGLKGGAPKKRQELREELKKNKKEGRLSTIKDLLDAKKSVEKKRRAK